MTFKKARRCAVDGTSLVAAIETSYANLVKVFGLPSRTTTPDHKVDAEWFLKFEDGTIATIYNYETGKRWNGSNGLPTSEITDWHIGGHDKIAYERVAETLVAVFPFVKSPVPCR